MNPLRRSRSRGLPGVVLLGLYGAALCGPLFLAAVGGPPPHGIWRELSSAIGLIAGAVLMLQLITSGRFEVLSGRIGIDVTMAFHKWTARILLVIVVVHPLLLLAPIDLGDPWSTLNHLVAMLAAPRYLTGTLALTAVILLVLLALLRDRLPVPYEVWRASHGLLAVAAVWLAAVHAAKLGRYSGDWAVRGFWFLLALMTTVTALIVYTQRAWWMRRHPWHVVRKRHVASNLWEITLGAKTKERPQFRAGQFAWIAFDPWRFPLFDHPFSIGSPPIRGDEISFIIKPAGDFTNRIGAIEEGTLVGVDLPHGSFLLDDLPARSVLLVAGGIGIAPILSILRDLASREDKRPVRLVYGCRDRAAMIDPREINAMAEGLDFRGNYLVEQVGHDALCELGVVSADRLKSALDGLDPHHTAGMICGPGVMTADIADNLHSLGVPLNQIRYERFDYAGASRSAKDRRVTMSFWLMAASVAGAGLAFALRP